MTLKDLSEAEVPLNNVAVQVLAQDIPIFGVEVFGQEAPFGGVMVVGATDQPLQIVLNPDGGNGESVNLVTSVFTRVGDIIALSSDYDAFYQPLDADLTFLATSTPAAGRYYGTNGGGAKGFYPLPSGGGTTTLPWKNVVDFGAVGNDTTDCTAAFNAAIAAAGPTGITYVPAGTYRILGQIELNGGSSVNWPARLVGTGPKLSSLHITSAALANQTVGTIQAARGAGVSDLRFFYDQPDVSTYGTFNQYKPVIYVNQLFRAPTALSDPESRGTGYHRGGRYERLRIELAWDGISCVSGAIVDANRPFFGQEVFQDLEMGTLNRGLSLDGLTDSCYVNRCRFFPYGTTTSQQVATVLPGHSVGIYAGRTDDLRVSDSFFYCGTALDLHKSLISGENSGPHAWFSNCGFDSFAHIEIGGGTPPFFGNAIFSNCLFSNTPATYPNDVPVRTSNIDTFFTGCRFVGSQVSTPPNNIVETGGNNLVSFDNCEFYLNTNDVKAITGSSNLCVSSCHFFKSDGIAFANAIINVTGGIATITGNQVTPITTGSGAFLSLTSDNYHTVTGNSASGFTANYPATPVFTQSFGNILSKVSLGSSGQNVSLGVKQLFVEGGSTGSLKVVSGSGSPETIVTADPGSLYLDTSSGGAGHYAKTTGTGNTGWIPMGAGGGGATEVWEGTDPPAVLGDYLLWIDTDAPPTPPAVGDLHYTHNQVATSASWSVTHNLGKFPAVSVVDSGGSEIIPNVLYTDANNLTVSFGSPTSGKAYLN